MVNNATDVDSFRIWKSLPAEIILYILQLTEEFALTEDLCNYALVCKAWLYSAQSVIYSNVSCIKTLSQLRKFANTVKHNASFGEMVKTFNLIIKYKDKDNDIQEKTKAEILDLLTTLLSDNLPNLETIGFFCTISYSPILQALNDSRLKRLKFLDPPDHRTDKCEVDNYIECALLLKDRLENIIIKRDDHYLEKSKVENISYHHLYEELHQFKNILKIDITRETSEEIQDLEYVVETCKSLKDITFQFVLPDDDEAITPPQNHDISVEAMSNITPRPEIKRLDCYLNASSGQQMLLYIIRKFPQLRNLRLQMINRGLETLNQHILTQLLYYLSNIDCYMVRDLTVDLNTFTDSIGSFWNAESRLGSEYVKICYSVWIRGRQHIIQLSKPTQIPRSDYTSLTYYLSDIEYVDWKHTDFLQQNGIYIRELQLNFDMVNIQLPEDWELPENFLFDVLTYCPNLKNLQLVNCILKQAPYTTTDLSTKFSLEELYMNDCELYNGMLEQLSLLVQNIKRLSIGFLRYKSQSTGRGHPNLEILMPHTEIDTIEFQRPFYSGNVYIELHVLNDKSYYHYRLDSIAKVFVVSSEEDYLSEGGGVRRIYIDCLNKPTIGVVPRKRELL